MAAGDIVPVTGEWFEQTLAEASPDVLRTMVREMAQRMMDAEVEQVCGAGYGEVSAERVNSRNGYRRREWDTRAGTSDAVGAAEVARQVAAWSPRKKRLFPPEDVHSAWRNLQQAELL